VGEGLYAKGQKDVSAIIHSFLFIILSFKKIVSCLFLKVFLPPNLLDQAATARVILVIIIINTDTNIYYTSH
jgi:hypothetical protein